MAASSDAPAAVSAAPAKIDTDPPIAVDPSTGTSQASAQAASELGLDTAARPTDLEKTSASPPVQEATPTAAAQLKAPSPTESSKTANDGTKADSSSLASGTTALAVGGADGSATASINEDINPLDFQGDVQTNNSLPSLETLRKLENYTVLDESGKSHTFRSLYTGHNVARRVLIIFVRHFFCGNCQEYLRTLSESITPDALLQLPIPTSIAVIGCGNYRLIGPYLQETGCPFPVYADNTQHLYRELGMIRTLQAGERPAYMQRRSMAQTVVSGIAQALRQVKTGLVLQMGDQKQVGGEFLFEPASRSLETPIETPVDESHAFHDAENAEQLECKGLGEEKIITWCHRMRNTRDHAEIPELRDVLGLEPEEDSFLPERNGSVDGAPPSMRSRAGTGHSGISSNGSTKDQARWAKALHSRKGTGLSMANQMNRMSLDAKGPPPQAMGVDTNTTVGEKI